MNNVNAQAIARVAKRRDVISEKVRNKILAAEAMDDANDTLFEHLRMFTSYTRGIRQ